MSHSLCSPPFPDAPRKEVYFMAIIDILTHYDAKKKAAHAAKTVKHGVSTAPAPRPHTAWRTSPHPTTPWHCLWTLLGLSGSLL